MMSREAGILLREVARLHALLQRINVACCDGTTLTQCYILNELGTNGSLTLTGLRNNLSLDKGWLSRAVEALEAEGLVIKEKSPSDARSAFIRLSESGEKRFSSLNDVLNEQSSRVLERIPPTEREGVLHSLALLHDALKEEATGPEGCCGPQSSRRKGAMSCE
jgi:DNA-binding MarR family transcriptional regulator